MAEERVKNGGNRKRKRGGKGKKSSKRLLLVEDEESEKATGGTALTVAQHVLATAPYHPQARQGRREKEEEEKAKKRGGGKGKSTGISVQHGHVSSIVDGWMRDMLAKHPSRASDERNAEGVSMEELQRPLRLGLGASYLAHAAAVDTETPEQRKVNQRIERSIQKQKRAVREEAGDIPSSFNSLSAKEKEGKKSKRLEEKDVVIDGEGRSSAVSGKKRLGQDCESSSMPTKKRKKKKATQKTWKDSSTWY